MRGRLSPLILSVLVSGASVVDSLGAVILKDAKTSTVPEQIQQEVHFPSARDLIEKYSPILDREFERIESEYTSKKENIRRAYVAYLKRARQDEQKEGNYERYIALSEELRLAESGSMSEEEGVSEEVADLRFKFGMGILSSEDNKYSQVISVSEMYLKWFGHIRWGFTKNGMIDEASRINEEMVGTRERAIYLEALGHMSKTVPENSPVRIVLGGRMDGVGARQVSKSGIQPYLTRNIKPDGTLIESEIIMVDPDSKRGGALDQMFDRGSFENLGTHKKVVYRFHVIDTPHAKTKDSVVVYLNDGAKKNKLGSIVGAGSGWNEIVLDEDKIINFTRSSDSDLHLSVGLEDTDGQVGLDGLKISATETGSGPQIIVN